MAKLCLVSGVDTDKNPTDSTPVISPDGKVEAVNGDVPVPTSGENGNNNLTDSEKVSRFINVPQLQEKHFFLSHLKKTRPTDQ